jgi:protein-tyrosine-phosphatase
MEHRAQSLGTGQLAGSDLVIGFEPFHVAYGVVTGGVPRSRAFLLAELARALDDPTVPASSDVSKLCALVARAEAVRTAGHWLPVSIPDPVGGSDRRFLETYEEIERIVATIARLLFGASTDRMG